MIDRILRDSTLYTLPVIVARGVNFLLLPFYTRILTPGMYGALDLLIVFGSLVSLIIPLEISQGAARYTAQAGSNASRKTTYASTALRFTVAGYLIFCALFLAIAPQASHLLLGDAGYAGIFRLAVAYIALNGLHALLLNQLKWELRSGAFAANHLLVALGSAVGSFLLAYGLNRGLAGIFEGMILGVFAGVTLGAWQLGDRVRGQFEMQALREMLVYSVPLAAAGIGVFVNTYVDRIMLNHFLSLESVGVYGMAIRIAGLTGLATVGVQSAISPLVFARHASPGLKTELAGFLRLFVAGVLLLMLFIKLFAREILVVVATPAYYSAAPLVVWLSAALIFAGMYVFAPGLSLAKKTATILVINLGGGILNLLLNLLLIPRLGIPGAAYATLTSAIAVFTVHLTFSHRYFPVPHDWQRLLLGPIVILPLALVGGLCDGTSLTSFVGKTVLLAAAVPALVLVGLVRRHEFQVVLKSLRR